MLDLRLSVSSNGSTWVKLRKVSTTLPAVCRAFSILERIDVGETRVRSATTARDAEIFQYPRTDRRG